MLAREGSRAQECGFGGSWAGAQLGCERWREVGLCWQSFCPFIMSEGMFWCVLINCLLPMCHGEIKYEQLHSLT